VRLIKCAQLFYVRLLLMAGAGCLQLLDTLPQSVYRVCDLLMVLTTRNGVQWQTEVLTSLISQVLLLCSHPPVKKVKGHQFV